MPEQPPAKNAELSKESVFTNVIANEARRFFQPMGVHIIFSTMDSNRFYVEQKDSPWRIIVNTHLYEDGNGKVNVELVPVASQATSPPATRIKYHLAKQPLLQTAVCYRGEKDAQRVSDELHEFFLNVEKVMKRETAQLKRETQKGIEM